MCLWVLWCSLYKSNTTIFIEDCPWMDITTLQCHFVVLPVLCSVQIMYTSKGATCTFQHCLVTWWPIPVVTQPKSMYCIIVYSFCCHRRALYLTFVPQKRRQAQLTRLHRQVQEAQARRRQWGNQVVTLRSTIALLQQKLTADSTLDWLLHYNNDISIWLSWSTSYNKEKRENKKLKH